MFSMPRSEGFSHTTEMYSSNDNYGSELRFGGGEIVLLWTSVSVLLGTLPNCYPPNTFVRRAKGFINRLGYWPRSSHQTIWTSVGFSGYNSVLCGLDDNPLNVV